MSPIRPAAALAGLGLPSRGLRDAARPVRSGDPARSEAVVGEWCATCHSVRGVETDRAAPRPTSRSRRGQRTRPALSGLPEDRTMSHLSPARTTRSADVRGADRLAEEVAAARSNRGPARISWWRRQLRRHPEPFRPRDRQRGAPSPCRPSALPASSFLPTVMASDSVRRSSHHQLRGPRPGLGRGSAPRGAHPSLLEQFAEPPPPAVSPGSMKPARHREHPSGRPSRAPEGICPRRGRQHDRHRIGARGNVRPCGPCIRACSRPR